MTGRGGMSGRVCAGCPPRQQKARPTSAGPTASPRLHPPNAPLPHPILSLHTHVLSSMNMASPVLLILVSLHSGSDSGQSNHSLIESEACANTGEVLSTSPIYALCHSAVRDQLREVLRKELLLNILSFLTWLQPVTRGGALR